jgi:hypothetical protein
MLLKNVLDRNARDKSQYIQDSIQITRGEQTFWEYHTQDIWQVWWNVTFPKTFGLIYYFLKSYMFGRPVSMTNTSIHCQWPSNIEVHPGHHPECMFMSQTVKPCPDGRIVFHWKFSFASLVSGIVEATGTPDVPYSSILDYDKRLREHPTPQGLEWPLPNPPSLLNEVSGRTFQRCIVAVWPQICKSKNCAFIFTCLNDIVALLYIHRPYFWQAVSKPGVVLVRHQYWKSLVAAYHRLGHYDNNRDGILTILYSACALVSCLQSLWLVYPKLLERLGPFWSHAHSACVSAIKFIIAAMSPNN